MEEQLDVARLADTLNVLVEAAQTGKATKQETVNSITVQLALFIKPVSGLGNDMMELMTKMAQVRVVQKKFFAGDKSVVKRAKTLEEECDQLMTRLCRKYNILIKEDSKKPDDPKLF